MFGNRDRQHKMHSPRFEGDRKRHTWFIPAVTAGSALLGAIGTAKTAFGDKPEAPPQIPETKPPAADPMAARYAQQRKTAARAGSRRETFLAGRKRPGAMNTMLG